MTTSSATPSFAASERADAQPATSIQTGRGDIAGYSQTAADVDAKMEENSVGGLEDQQVDSNAHEAEKAEADGSNSRSSGEAELTAEEQKGVSEEEASRSSGEEDEDGSDVEWVRPKGGYAQDGWWRTTAWKNFRGHVEQQLQQGFGSRYYYKPKIDIHLQHYNVIFTMPPPPTHLRYTRKPGREERREVDWWDESVLALCRLIIARVEARRQAKAQQQQSEKGEKGEGSQSAAKGIDGALTPS